MIWNIQKKKINKNIYVTVSFKCYILDKLKVFHSLFWCIFGSGGESDGGSENKRTTKHNRAKFWNLSRQCNISP